VLTPAEADGGTNLLALRGASLIEPCFGEGSFTQHREQARARNLSYGIFRAQGLGHDIDRPGDLVISAGSDAKHASALIERLNIAARLATEQRQSA
jgi:2-phospho-L-lactate guanylyltransferase (CobY/MobA/RfbA family)